MMMKFIGPVAWGGSDDNETLLDVLTSISKTAESIRYTRIMETSGGWPVFQFECEESDLEKVAEFLECEVEDLEATSA